MIGFYVAFGFLCLFCVIAVFFSVYSLVKVQEMLGYIKSLQKAPILREYVKEFVPIDESDKAKEIIANKMREHRDAFESMVDTNIKTKQPAKNRVQNIFNAEDFV